MKKLEELYGLIDSSKKMKLVVVAAEEENVLIAVDNAFKQGIIHPILVGDLKKIRNYAKKK